MCAHCKEKLDARGPLRPAFTCNSDGAYDFTERQSPSSKGTRISLQLVAPELRQDT